MTFHSSVIMTPVHKDTEYWSQYLTKMMQKICFTISFISYLHMFWAHVLTIRRSKLHHTASGIVTPIGGRVVHGLRQDSILCIKLGKYWDKYTEIHGQQNAKKQNIEFLLWRCKGVRPYCHTCVGMRGSAASLCHQDTFIAYQYVCLKPSIYSLHVQIMYI